MWFTTAHRPVGKKIDGESHFRGSVWPKAGNDSLCRDIPVVFGGVTDGSRGFTLIELLVVLSILGVSAGMVTITVGFMDNKSRLTSACEELATLLEMLSSRAAITRSPLLLSFNREGGRIWVIPVESDEDQADWSRQLPHGASVKSVRIGRRPGQETSSLLIQPSGYICDATIIVDLHGSTMQVRWEAQRNRCFLGENQ